MNNFNVNITPEDVLAQSIAEAPQQKKVNTFDAKKYLNTRLNDKETSKTLTIRLLPFSPEGGSPFHKVHFHNVRVNKEVAESGWKKFPCPIHNGKDSKCPYCETAEEARKLKIASPNEQEKKKYNEIEFANRAKEMWVVRCIERGHEEDGVKFWLFSHSKKGDGVYNKIMNIFTQRYNKAKEQGKFNNIFDLNEGKDLLITITKDSNGKSVINVADDDEKTPLSSDYETALAWVNDDKKWEDVYTVKPYDFLAIVLQGGVPKFDKDKGCYVDRAEANAQAEAEIEKNLSHPNRDLSVIETVTTPTNLQETNTPTLNQCFVDDTDLPF